MSKTKVTLLKVEPDQTIVKRDGVGTYQATKLTYTIGGVQEVKNIMNTQLSHPNGAQVSAALAQLAQTQLPVDVVLDEVKNGTFDNIVQILPKDTPEENPRQAKKPFVAGGGSRFGGGGAKGYSKSDIAGMRRSVALQAAANANVGRTSQEVIDAARVFEKFLNELDAIVIENSAVAEVKTQPVPKLVF